MLAILFVIIAILFMAKIFFAANSQDRDDGPGELASKEKSGETERLAAELVASKGEALQLQKDFVQNKNPKILSVDRVPVARILISDPAENAAKPTLAKLPNGIPV